jgi:hypothetical protein
MQSAAGGTSQRLKPAVAIVRSLSRNPVPAPGMLPALLIVVIAIFPCSPSLNWAFLSSFDPVVFTYAAEQPHPASHCRSGNARDRHGAFGNPTTLHVLIMRFAALPAN